MAAERWRSTTSQEMALLMRALSLLALRVLLKEQILCGEEVMKSESDARLGLWPWFLRDVTT